SSGRKLAEIDARCASGVDGFRNAAPPKERLSAERCQKFLREAGVCGEGKDWQDIADRYEEADGGRTPTSPAWSRYSSDRRFVGCSAKKLNDTGRGRIDPCRFLEFEIASRRRPRLSEAAIVWCT